MSKVIKTCKNNLLFIELFADIRNKLQTTKTTLELLKAGKEIPSEYIDKVFKDLEKIEKMVSDVEIIDTIKIKNKDSMTKRLNPIHPGEILNEEFLKPLSLSQNRIARDISVPPRRINEIVSGKRRVTADTALRLAIYFKTSPQFWMNLQSEYDLNIELDEVGNKVSKEVYVCSFKR